MEKIIQSVAYRSQERKNAMEHLMKRYPVIQKAAIGQSCAGQEIALYRLGKGKKHDLLTAAFHGSEEHIPMIKPSAVFLSKSVLIKPHYWWCRA